LLINLDLEGGVLYFPASMLGVFVILVPGVPFTARRLARLFQFCKKYYSVFVYIQSRHIWALCAEFQGLMERKVNNSETEFIETAEIQISSSAEIKNVCSCTSPHSYILTVWCIMKQMKY
jgi:hypothetical protein